MRKTKKTLAIIMAILKYILALVLVKFSKIKHDDIWLISERGDDARDNGYCFYTFLKNKQKKQKIKYVINSKSADAKKISKEDQIEYGSFKHYIYFLTSNILISTHVMGFSPNMSLFSRLDKKGLLKLKGKIVFLQHGITQNKIDFNNNTFHLITTASKMEMAGIAKDNPRIANSIKTTGFSRYDTLKDESFNKKIILFMPTFRKWLNFLSNDSFKKTEYYKKTSSFLHNQELKELLAKNKYKLIFYPHYEVQKRITCYSSDSNNIIIADFNNYDVQDLLNKSCILITDYSSVFFDFAYMNKPILYYQFDKKEFEERHYKKGYFDYDIDGFGKIINREERLVKEISRIMLNHCENDPLYTGRIKSFFKFNDNDNSKRIYEEIKRIENE